MHGPEHDEESDVIRWGLDLLGGGPYPNPGYCNFPQSDITYYNAQEGSEGNVDANHSIIENDEIIAHALQEELSQLAVAEASGPSLVDDENQQASVLAQDWFGSSSTACNFGNDGCGEEGDDNEISSSCSSPEESFHEVGDYLLELTDEYSALDGEVGKRLNQMVPTPHVPRVNGEIPSIDEATSDHQRLLDRLRMYNLVELKVQGDGNCQFRALSDQFYRTSEHHKFVRQQVVNQLRTHREIYEGYVPMTYEEYLTKISEDGEWGDHVTVQAAADSYGVKIVIITSFKDTHYFEILPCAQKSKRVIFLSFWAEVHYNSIYPEGDLPVSDPKKKRRWWRFRNKN